jgi:hypothetical protein
VAAQTLRQQAGNLEPVEVNPTFQAQHQYNAARAYRSQRAKGHAPEPPSSPSAEIRLLHRQQKLRCPERLLRHRLTWTRSHTHLCTQTEHVLDLFWLILLGPTEDVRFRAFRIAKFVYLCLLQVINNFKGLAYTT